MEPPFTVEQFLDSIARYNQAIWPLHFVFYAMAAALVALAVRASRSRDRWISGSLGFLWAWMGIVYHWGFFAPVNKAAYVFGGLFIVQAIAFIAAGVRRQRLSFRFQADQYGIVGVVLIAYALVLYPVVGALAGHAYPNGPTFGLPCPTTIVTFGLLLWTDRRVPVWLLVIPALWSVVGFTAALLFGIVEDVGLLAAGVVGTSLILFRNSHLNVT